ncbi:hypothetical protein [Rhodopirellula europaea]|nr:hypothetical protein [Rhodopirellula europaea]
MAKNSDKSIVLQRRRIELLNAIKHDASAEFVAKRIDALKQAVFGVAKKHHARYRPFTRFAENSEWQMVVRYWTALTPDSVVAVVTSWPDRPAYKEVLLACRDAADEPTQKTQDGG